MKKVIFLLTLSLLASPSGYAQTSGQRIHFRIMTLTPEPGSFEIPPEMSIDIRRQAKNIKIIFSKTDSLNQLAMVDDPEFTKGLTLATKPDDKLETMFAHIRKHSAIFHMDSISIPDRGAYSELVDLVWNHDLDAPPAVVSDTIVIEHTENKPMESDDEGALMLQLYRFSGNKLKDRHYVSSHTKGTYPDIYNLIAASLELYRKDHPDSFLDKKYVPY